MKTAKLTTHKGTEWKTSINGDIKNITIIEAGRDILARAAVTTIERLDGKFPLPSEPLILHVPIMYKLR